MDAFYLQSSQQRAVKLFGSQKLQPSVINDRVIPLARSTLRTQVSFHLEKQSGFPDSEVFRSREKKEDCLWETKDVLESIAPEWYVTFSAVQLQAVLMAVLT